MKKIRKKLQNITIVNNKTIFTVWTFVLTFIILDVIDLIVPIDLAERNPIKEWLNEIQYHVLFT